MLDIDTKRRIDEARDILVGKIPDPKSQVEQITIALIYKFMNDIDAQSEALGGRRTFFAGEFAKYRWANLIHSGLGGHETLNLYAEALTRIPENPSIPPLFRDIFNNVYLPYRDPETLRMFLTVIDDFTYDHSERLGDAFEHLLSVMGSQGDAGQFRTPRHIIDFMVKIIDPQKHERVLDPACGTAGFLISSYKHIRDGSSQASGEDAERPPLTPDEHARLVRSLTGYDISPDMVRLSLVNMYLHGFPQPSIHEYDTLTSEERWDEYADVILANPPFMSPKGGIRPHSRFSVQSRRSEVLFVDYIAEHLTPGGRAAVIVPEGVIFQSQNAHKSLRKMLVEDYLVAVVSLPAGVFQPYSGVKTSILILDRAAARRAKHIAFFKVESDGYDLGAQRRPVAENDLPGVESELAECLRRLQSGESLDDFRPAHGFVVEKERIGEDGDFNLSGERYREESRITAKYSVFEIGSLIKTVTPPTKIPKSKFSETGLFPIIDQSQDKIAGWTDNSAALVRAEKPLVIFGDHTCAVKLMETPFAQGADGIKILNTVDDLEPGFLYHFLKVKPLENRGYRRHFSVLKKAEIPLPPLEVQREIVAEIEGYQRVIDGARAVVDNWKPHIAINPEWTRIKIKNLFTFSKETVLPATITGPISYIGLENISRDTGKLVGATVVDNPSQVKSAKNVFRKGDLLYGRLRPNLNKAWLADREGICSTDILVMRPVEEETITGLYAYLMRSESFNSSVLQRVTGAQLPRISAREFANLDIFVPPLDVQRAIVAEIESERAIVDANRELVERMEGRIAAAIGRVWSG